MALLKQIRNKLAKTKLRAPLIWLRNRTLQENDVLIACYPRSGSTWFNFLMVEILTRQPTTFPLVGGVIRYVGKQLAAPRVLPGGGHLVRTHELYRRKYERAVYLVRDVRDVVVSEYFYEISKKTHTKDFEDFLVQFLNGQANQFGSWWDHVNSWLGAAATKKADLIVVKYEDMHQNTEETLVKALDFLGVSVEAWRIRDAIQSNSIERMREKEDNLPRAKFRNHRRDMRFVREGSIGGWRQILTDHQVRLIEQHAGETMSRLGYRLENHAHANKS